VTATERRDYQIVPVSLKVAGSEVVAEIHLSLADASGDSAVIEFVDGGTPRIHRGRSVTVLTNEPLYEEQLENLKHYQGFGGTAPLPGTGSPLDRFVRASYYLKDLERPKDTRAAIAGVLSIVRNVSVPLVKPVSSAESPFDSVFSVWHTVADATDRIYFFESTQAPVLVWVDLDDLDLKPGAPVLKLDLVNGGDLAGDMAKSFKPSTPMQFRKGSTDLASGGRPQAESNL
jgi:choloylglycine hydrolase